MTRTTRCAGRYSDLWASKRINLSGCVYCHSFRGTGARSHHVHALTGKPQGGFALALEDYPVEVWRNFLFNQVEVAKKMGATPNMVPESARQPLFDLVNKARGQAAK